MSVAEAFLLSGYRSSKLSCFFVWFLRGVRVSVIWTFPIKFILCVGIEDRTTKVKRNCYSCYDRSYGGPPVNRAIPTLLHMFLVGVRV